VPLNRYSMPKDWHAHLSRQAEESWGPERAIAIDAALVRMTAAIARVLARRPLPQTPLHQADQTAPRRRNAARG